MMECATLLTPVLVSGAKLHFKEIIAQIWECSWDNWTPKRTLKLQRHLAASLLPPAISVVPTAATQINVLLAFKIRFGNSKNQENNPLPH